MRQEPPGIRSFHEASTKLPQSFPEASPKLPQATPAHDGAASTRTHDGAHSPWGRHAHDGAHSPWGRHAHDGATLPSLTADTPTTAPLSPHSRPTCGPCAGSYLRHDGRRVLWGRDGGDGRGDELRLDRGARASDEPCVTNPPPRVTNPPPSIRYALPTPARPPPSSPRPVLIRAAPRPP